MGSEPIDGTDFFAATKRDVAEMGAVALAAASGVRDKVVDTTGAGKSFNGVAVAVFSCSGRKIHTTACIS